MCAPHHVHCRDNHAISLLRGHLILCSHASSFAVSSLTRRQALGVCSRSDRSALKKKLKEVRKLEEKRQKREEQEKQEKNVVLCKETEDKARTRVEEGQRPAPDAPRGVKTVRTESIL